MTVLVWPPQSTDALVGLGWGDVADGDAWAALVGWADWFMATYDFSEPDGILQPCWPDHPGVVEELAALWMAWVEAAAKSQNGDGDAMAYWHDRYLAGFMVRMPRYRMRSCRPDRHSERIGQAHRTNGALVQVRETAVSREELITDEAPAEPRSIPDHHADDPGW